MTTRTVLFSICIMLSICRAGYPQSPKERQLISYQSFIESVWKQNLGYAAEKLNIDVAEAELKAAKVFSDPTLSVEYADNDDSRMQMGRSVSVELSKTFSIGKRGARIDLAKSEKELNEALLENYFHTLRAEATMAYLEALKNLEIYYIKDNSYRNMRNLAEGDSVRYALGKITQTDALQSHLEAGIAENEAAQAETEFINSRASLKLWTGEREAQNLDEEASRAANQYALSSGKFEVIRRIFNVEELLQTALTNRADLAAALKNVDIAAKELKVAQRERNVDFDVALGYNYNTEVRNEIAPAPKFNGVTLGVAIPLKFSNANKGAVRAAEFRRRQAEFNYRQAELEVENSVMQSFRQYNSSLEQMRRFDNGLLNDADQVLEGKIYSYKLGETSRLDVLVAQQVHNELRIAYAETVFNCIAALVELERNAGIWDITIE